MFPPEGSGHSLPVVSCKEFLEDPEFQEIWEVVKKNPGTKNLPDVIRSIVNNPLYIDDLSQNLNITTDMDSVFFLKDKFQVILDARGYAPEEIICIVKTQIVEVSAEKTKFNSKFTRRMCRKYSLPNPVIPEKSCCTLSNDGILVVTAPWKL